MKVESMNIKNFKGIKDMSYEFKKPVSVISGKVGAGKTSFIQALRFGLTNETPFDPINSDESEASVILNCQDDLVIERSLARPNKKSTKIMGRKTGTAASESFLEESTNVSNEIMKIATASEVLAAMKPAQFAAIFINESTQKKTFDDLVKILVDSKSKEKSAVMAGFDEEEEEGKLPPDVMSMLRKFIKTRIINLDALNKAYEEAKVEKRSVNALYKVADSKSKDFLDIVKPEYTESDLNKKYEEIVGVEKNVEAYKTQVDAYDKAKAAKLAQDKRISELDLLIAMNSATEPDAAEYKSLTEKKKAATEDLVNNSKIHQTLSDNRKFFERTLTQLDKPVCPISEKLVCNTDKTSFRNELEEEIKKIDLSLSVVDDKIKMAKARIAEIEEKISDYNKNKENYMKKSTLSSERANLIKNPVKVPEEPERLRLKSSYAKEKAEIKEKMETLREYKATEVEYKEAQKLKRELTVIDFVVKSLDPKGPVIKEFIKTFVDCLEDQCNDRAELLKTGFELRLVPEDGIKVLFKTADGKNFLPYASLSAGEKIFASLILTDLINSFYDSRILILDDTDHLDAESFRTLMDFICTSDITELYDNIIISCVEHSDMMEVAKEYDVDLLEM